MVMKKQRWIQGQEKCVNKGNDKYKTDKPTYATWWLALLQICIKSVVTIAFINKWFKITKINLE